MMDCQLIYSVIGIWAHFGGCLSVEILCDLNWGCIPTGQFLICLCLSLEKLYWSKTNFMLIPWPSLLSSLGCPCWSEAGTCLCARREEKLDMVLWELQTKWETGRRQTLLSWCAGTLTLPAESVQQECNWYSIIADCISGPTDPRHRSRSLSLTQLSDNRPIPISWLWQEILAYLNYKVKTSPCLSLPWLSLCVHLFVPERWMEGWVCFFQ